MIGLRRCILASLLLLLGSMAAAQDLTFATVNRAPFAVPGDDGPTGFSIDLMQAIGAELDQSVGFAFSDSFSEMLLTVQSGDVDGAIANISITAEREALMDFSQPVFDSGIQVMVPQGQGAAGSIVSAIFTRQFAGLVLAGIAMLVGAGLLMWFFERGRQSWFDKPASEAAFPAFWWALNLILNGGFEERMPHSRMGRLLAIFLVIASLFFVSIFVAQITATLTVEAIANSVDDLDDLDGRSVGTISGSTTASFLDQRGMSHIGYDDLETMLAAFESGALDAVVFDGPILAYYASDVSNGQARVLEKVYRPENYGIAFPTGSDLQERVDQAILRLRENGTYEDILTKWFGATYNAP